MENMSLLYVFSHLSVDEHFLCLLAICISSVIAFAHFVKPVFYFCFILLPGTLCILDMMIVAYNCSWSICCLLILFIMSLLLWKSFVYMLILHDTGEVILWIWKHLYLCKIDLRKRTLAGDLSTFWFSTFMSYGMLGSSL